MGEMLRMEMGDGAEVGVYHVLPEGERKGSIVLFHEILGVNSSIRRFCDSLAPHGYEVFAPALFDRVQPGFEGDIERLEEAFDVALKRHPFEQSVADALHLIGMLKAKGPVFVAGFCYGGSLTFRVAQIDGEIAAASSFYGNRVAGFADQPVLVPTICHFGRKDEHIPLEGVEQIIAKRPEVKTYLYDAGHGFVLGKPDNNPEAAKMAVGRMLDLFEANRTRRTISTGSNAK